MESYGRSSVVGGLRPVMLADGLALQRRPSLDRHAVANLVRKIRIGRGQGGHATDAHGRRTWASLSDAPSRTSAFEHMMQFDIVTCRVEVRVSTRVGSARNATLGRRSVSDHSVLSRHLVSDGDVVHQHAVGHTHARADLAVRADRRPLDRRLGAHLPY